MDGARGGEYYKIKATVVQWKDIRPWHSEFGPEEKHFVSGNYGNSLFLFLGEQRSCDGGGARSARLACL